MINLIKLDKTGYSFYGKKISVRKLDLSYNGSAIVNDELVQRRMQKITFLHCLIKSAKGNQSNVWEIRSYWSNLAVQRDSPLFQVLKALLLDHMPFHSSQYTHLICSTFYRKRKRWKLISKDQMPSTKKPNKNITCFKLSSNL